MWGRESAAPDRDAPVGAAQYDPQFVNGYLPKGIFFNKNLDFSKKNVLTPLQRRRGGPPGNGVLHTPSITEDPKLQNDTRGQTRQTLCFHC